MTKDDSIWHKERLTEMTIDFKEHIENYLEERKTFSNISKKTLKATTLKRKVVVFKMFYRYLTNENLAVSINQKLKVLDTYNLRNKLHPKTPSNYKLFVYYYNTRVNNN